MRVRSIARNFGRMSTSSYSAAMRASYSTTAPVPSSDRTYDSDRMRAA